MAPLSTTADARDHLDPWGFGRGDTDDLTESVEDLDPLDEFVDIEDLPALLATPAGPSAPRAASLPPSSRLAVPARPNTARALATLRLPVSPERVGVLALFGAVIIAQGFYIGFSLTGEASSRRGVGEVLVSSHPSGAQVRVDGRVHGSTPLVLALDAGRHAVDLVGANGSTQPVVVDVEAGTRLTRHVVLPTAAAAASRVGALRIDTGAAPARVLIDDAPMGAAPVRRDDVVAGDHTVTVQFARGGSVTRRVNVPAGESVAVMVEPPAIAPVAAKPASGWVALSAPFEVQVYEDGQLVGTSASERLLLPAGAHALELVNADLGYRARVTATVAAGKTAALPVDAPRVAVHVNATPWAEVAVDGRALGETPLANVLLPIGPHTLTFVHPELGERVETVVVRAGGPNRVAADLRQGRP